uniref:Uncharacterized protein n=1 Tax=Panagrolaimus sp. JU765 TaxID=591449 RepID=A0AC34R8M9_9BILA
MISTRYLLCLVLGLLVIFVTAYQSDDSEDKIQFVKRLPEYDPAYIPAGLWDLDEGVRLKKWASQLRFGKRSGSSWASQVRFG